MTTNCAHTFQIRASRGGYLLYCRDCPHEEPITIAASMERIRRIAAEVNDRSFE